ncbi:hypothetical protein B0A48_11621 [Cryoendolithus antarcticus]|uniref:Phospholipid-transporting ATPase n=1 Tax=Cryoendolithus antarcticus TaxID=1507870 RepID=A0A1V8SW38_9PEZI|nr:hypothetical protein B0A48_11621 [Cryoendolithus antarcticus]
MGGANGSHVEEKTAAAHSDSSSGEAGEVNKQSPTVRSLARRANIRLGTTYESYVAPVFRGKVLAPSKDGRHIPIQACHDHSLIDERRGHNYISNSIRSARYTPWDFFPRQLWFQLTRLSNFYFLCVGVPQTIPGLSTTGNYTTILPLTFFVLLTMFKEGWDDWRRHKMDKVENRATATVLKRRGSQSQAGVMGGKPWSRIGRTRATDKQAEMVKGNEEQDADFSWTHVQWHNIRVGDFVMLKRDDPVPADLVLLHASGEEGVAYIETMALDGETNLKAKQALSATQKQCGTIAGIRECNGSVAVEDPNRTLYSFDGRMMMDDHTRPLTLSEILLRGSTLRNTTKAIGLVVNTGEETKIRMNANHHPKAKKPRLERYANQVILTLIAYVVILAVGCSGGYLLWHNQVEQQSWYMEDAPVGFQEIIIGYLIMFNNLIPLSLYVSLEIVKLCQQWLITNDVTMYDEVSNEPMRCNTNTILENLGQVGFILSDKTGTLTENVMKFRKLSVAGTVWRHGIDDQDTATSASRRASHQPRRSGAVKPSIEVTEFAFEKGQESLRPQVARRSSSRPRVSAASTREQSTTDLIAQINAHPNTAFSCKARNYLLGLALCHTCLPELKDDGAVDFQASSPDELALVRVAHELGFTILARSTHSITLLTTDRNGEQDKSTYEILDVIEFSSKRKRMSIVLRCPDGKVWLLCKGADSVLIPRLKQAELAVRTSRDVRRSTEVHRRLNRRSIQLDRRTRVEGRASMAIERIRRSMDVPRSRSQPRARSLAPPGRSTDGLRVPTFDRRQSQEQSPTLDDAQTFARCFQHLDDFATEGLRTLLFTQKVIPAAEYTAWKKLYQDATTSLVDRQQRIEDVAEMLEQDMDLLGASAIEDKLQEGVPETIDKLRRANIKIWMLTGDKRETAINIAHSARICKPESHVFIFDASKGDLPTQLQNAAETIATDSITHSVAVIDGYTLSVVDASPDLQKQFYSLIFALSSVICCRASPAQKASIALSIPQHLPNTLTLAIGDGANDVAMLQSAHVGVGISGKEGLQAARVADYSIAQFRFLQQLLLVHGRWNYVRTARFVLATFWKEMLFYTPQAMYQRSNGYTGTSLYESWSLTALNTLFTSLCVIMPGIVERDLSAKTLLAVPELYAYGQQNSGLNLRRYLVWMIGGLAQGVIIFIIPWLIYAKGNEMGDNGLFALGDLCFTIAIVWTNVKLLLLETHTKSLPIAVSFTVTFTGWWAWNCFLSAAYPAKLSPYDVKGGFFHTFGKDLVWWLVLIGTISILVVMEFTLKTIKSAFRGNKWWQKWGGGMWEGNVALWQEIERKGGVQGDEDDNEDQAYEERFAAENK